MAKTKRAASSATEWIGGLVSLPGKVTDEGDAPFRPEMLLWMLADGAVLGTAVVKPGEASTRATEHFHETTREPMVGPAHVPSRVRVESPVLAETLRASLGTTTEVICAPTPELDAIAAALREHLGGHGDGELRTHLGPGITPDAMGSFFHAAARLFRTAPWKVVPDDTSIFSVTIESLGVRDAVISVMGQLGQSLGFLLFENVDDFEAFLDVAADAADGMPPTALPSHLALNFEPRDELDPALREEIATHEWEVAGPEAYPLVMAVDEDLVARPPTPEELTRLEAIALALAELVETEPQLAACWDDGSPVLKTLLAKTSTGPVSVALTAPYYGNDAPAPRAKPAAQATRAKKSKRKAARKARRKNQS